MSNPEYIFFRPKCPARVKRHPGMVADDRPEPTPAFKLSVHIGQDVFFAARSSADCIMNMFGLISDRHRYRYQLCGQRRRLSCKAWHVLLVLQTSKPILSVVRGRSTVGPSHSRHFAALRNLVAIGA